MIHPEYRRVERASTQAVSQKARAADSGLDADQRIELFTGTYALFA
jgi:hypothetical protein